MTVSSIDRIQGGSFAAHIAWAEKIRETQRIKKLTTPLVEGISGEQQTHPPVFKNRKHEISEIYIIDYALTVPDTLLYSGEGESVWGIARNKLLEIDSLLKQDNAPNIPYIIKITADTVDTILSLLKNRDNKSIIDSRFIEAGIVPGMMMDRYL